MTSDIMNRARAVRREDLFRDVESQVDRYAGDGKEDEEAAAARAALDAYMKDSLGLQFDIPLSRPALSKTTEDNTKESDDDSDDDSDGSMDSSGDDKKHSKSKSQRKKKEASGTQKTSGTTEFAFRLFSGSGNAAAAANNTSTPATSTVGHAPMVLLDDGDLPLRPGGLLNPPRPLSFYLAGEPTAVALARYAQITVTGEDVVNGSKTTPRSNRAWGWEVPWRARTVFQASSKSALRALLANALAPGEAAVPENLVMALASATNALPSWASQQSQSPDPILLRQPLSDSLPTETTKHRRPGKRRRIILRKREQIRREQEAKAAAQMQSKEDHLSEKKKRLNRIKKLRRREKKKQTAKLGEEGGGGDSGDGSSDD